MIALKNSVLLVVGAFLLSAIGLTAHAQGTVKFSNFGLNASFSVNGTLAGAGYYAQLQFADGTDVGDRTEFLTEGLFSGGIRTVPRQPADSVVLKVAVQNAAGEILTSSNSFSVILGGAGIPPTAPAPLKGLTPWDGTLPTIASSLAVEMKVGYQLLGDGQLQLKWPAGGTLMGATSLEPGEASTPITPAETLDGVHTVTLPLNQARQFFWLDE